MVKKQTSKKREATTTKASTASGLKAFINEHLVLILGTSVIVLSVVIVFLFWGINQYNTQQAIKDQRKQFDSAEASLDALYAQIVQEVGQPTEVKKDKSCGYRSAKLDQGERHCNIYIGLFYDKIKDKPQALLYSNGIEKLITENTLFSNFEKNAAYADPYISNEALNSSTTFTETSTQMKCSASYEIDPWGQRSPNIYRVGLSCSSTALSEFYPVKD